MREVLGKCHARESKVSCTILTLICYYQCCPNLYQFLLKIITFDFGLCFAIRLCKNGLKRLKMVFTGIFNFWLYIPELDAGRLEQIFAQNMKKD